MQEFPDPGRRFFNPANIGDVAEPSFCGRSASFTCGAALRISLRVNESQTITEAKFKAAGCSVLVASASLLTEQVTGKTTGEAAVIVQETIKHEAGALDENRAECVAMAAEALLSAIAKYSDSARDGGNGDDVLICTCFGVSEKTIEDEIQMKGLSTILEVTKACNAGAGCRSCYPLIEDIIEEVNSE